MKRPFASEQERKTKTLSETNKSSEHIIEGFVRTRKSLIREDLKRYSGARTVRRYTDLVDRFIRSLFLAAGFGGKAKEIVEGRLALVALGSYGRRELCLGSDVDLLIIHQGRLSPEMNEVIPQSLYPLWDAKLEVGHTVLTVPECIHLAMDDFRVLTSLMDARFVMGSRAFYRLFEIALWSRIERQKSGLLKQFLVYQQKREEKYNGGGYFLEPDIKEGMGGLRDTHFMAWMARIYFKSTRLAEIKRFPVFSHFGLDSLSHSKGFLLKVRNHLHLLADRREDRLLLSYQEELSRGLDYQDGPYMRAADKFMKDLYLHLNRIRYGYEEFQTKALELMDPSSAQLAPELVSQDFQVVKGNILLREGSLWRKGPLTILKALDEANRRDLFLGPELIWEARKLIAAEGRRLVGAPGARELFLGILLRPTNHRIIRLALEIGLISLFVPEFKKIRNLAQFGYYHVETVDLHSLKTLEVIDGIAKGAYDERWPLLRETYGELKHPEWLALAGLLHDLGKGYPGDHTKKGAQLLPRILNRLGMTGDVVKVVVFLVRHHLLLVRISQRRDLNEEKTSVQVAQSIQDRDVLRLLFLLTIADSIATGPIASSDWRIILVIELFFKVRHILERGTLASPDATKRHEENKKSLLKLLAPDFPKGDILDLMDQVSSRYFINVPLDDMAHHFRLALTMGEQRLSWTLHKRKDAPVTRVILCTYDKPGLFSKMVGVFAINNVKVLSANIFTLKNGLAFDIYEVTNPVDPFRESESWEKIYGEIALALEDQISLDDLVEEKRRGVQDSMEYWGHSATRVHINNEVSDFFTVIEVSSVSRIGLLYELAKGMFSLGLDIRFARVNSDKEKMTGAFYVRDSDGQKVVDADQIQKIKTEIMAMIFDGLKPAGRG